MHIAEYIQNASINDGDYIAVQPLFFRLSLIACATFIASNLARPLLAYDSTIVLNEIMPAPNGENEWVELFNTTDTEFVLIGWIIAETAGSGFSNHDIPSIILPAQESCYLEIQDINNTNGTVKLIDNLESEVDSYSYKSSVSGKSMTRVPDGAQIWQENVVPTKSTHTCEEFKALMITDPPEPTPAPITTPKPTPKPTQPPAVFELSQTPTSMNTNEIVIGSIKMTGLDTQSPYYLKGAFFKAGATNYFGFTESNSGWVENTSKYSEQLKITTDSSGTWTGNIKVKPDPQDSGFSGSGSYSFKVGRYAASGSGPTWSNSVPLTITLTSVSTAPPITSSPPPLGNKISQVLGAKTNLTSSETASESSVAAKRKLPKIASSSSSSADASDSMVLAVHKSKSNNLFFIGGGLLLLIGVGVFGYKKLI